MSNPIIEEFIDEILGDAPAKNNQSVGPKGSVKNMSPPARSRTDEAIVVSERKKKTPPASKRFPRTLFIMTPANRAKIAQYRANHPYRSKWHHDRLYLPSQSQIINKALSLFLEKYSSRLYVPINNSKDIWKKNKRYLRAINAK